MRKVFITSDNHVDDPTIVKYRPECGNIRHHNNITWGLLDQVPEGSLVIFLGDCFLSPASILKLMKYKFQKVLIMGNHELEHGVTMGMLQDAFTEIHASYRLGNWWLTHIPMHPLTLGQRRNIHGHIHKRSKLDRDDRYVNVTLEATRYRLIEFSEIESGEYVPWE